jgi:DNA helicase HerA-like ATPase
MPRAQPSVGGAVIIPEAALQQHIAVLGKTGSGKSFAAKAAIVEPLLERGRRVGVIDPTGAWWGLRSSRDGKGAGFPILVLGEIRASEDFFG